MPVTVIALLMGIEALRDNQMKMVFCPSHRDIEQTTLLFNLEVLSVAKSDGMQPSTQFRTNTEFHSWPLAEWIVDRIR